ncbi:MAG: hypothetical protein EOM10_02650, partial [Opitutae bacterium]|nr:hypothetical protein [Opitutae bacterium]
MSLLRVQGLNGFGDAVEGLHGLGGGLVANERDAAVAGQPDVRIQRNEAEKGNVHFRGHPLAAPVDGAVIVTTPQRVSTADVRRSIRFCRKL